MDRVLLLFLLVVGCSTGGDPRFLPLTYLTLEDLRTVEGAITCDPTEFPAVIGTYEVTNTVPSETEPWQFYVAEVVVQPVTGMFDVRIRGVDDYFTRLEPGESATVEIWALEAPAPGQRVEFRIGYHYVPAAEADADARLATTYTTELGTELFEYVWDCGV